MPPPEALRSVKFCTTPESCADCKAEIYFGLLLSYWGVEVLWEGNGPKKAS